MHEKLFLASMSLTALLATSVLGRVILHNFPNSGDEWCYLLQAEIFSQGKLSVASPPHREFFDVGWMINNGAFYTQHPPGWPLVLAAGVLLGVPWLINPLLGMLTLLVVYALGKTMYDTRVAAIALLLMLGSPFFLFNSASYWAHPASLLFLTLSLLYFVKGLEAASVRSLVIGGLCGSLSFLIRPLEQVAFLVACGLFCLFHAVRHRQGLKAGSVFLGTHLVGVLLLLGYHTLQNGHPFVTGYQLAYSATGAPNMLLTLPTWRYIDDYLLSLVVWTVPGLPLLAGGYSVAMLGRHAQGTRAREWDGLLLLSCASCIVLYALVAYPSLVGYGPRYYYSLLGALVLLAARGIVTCMAIAMPFSRRHRHSGSILGAGTLLVTLFGLLTWHIARESAQLHQRMTLQRMIEERALQNAVVFIGASSGDFDPNDLTRNRLDFQGDVIYVLDQGKHNHVIMEQYPRRRYFLYAYDQTTDHVELREIFARCP
jgi:4-amino-4-deoxy-L-arabinose transferase-like glycosyltransferase